MRRRGYTSGMLLLAVALALSFLVETCSPLSLPRSPTTRSIAKEWRVMPKYLTTNNKTSRQSFMVEVPENSEYENEKGLSANEDDAAEQSGSIARTLLLAVPLFCKFVIVLLIKFLTDAVVFPLLFISRFTRLTKKRFMGMIGKGGKSPSSNRGGTKP